MCVCVCTYIHTWRFKAWRRYGSRIGRRGEASRLPSRVTRARWPSEGTERGSSARDWRAANPAIQRCAARRAWQFLHRTAPTPRKTYTRPMFSSSRSLLPETDPQPRGSLTPNFVPIPAERIPPHSRISSSSATRTVLPLNSRSRIGSASIRGCVDDDDDDRGERRGMRGTGGPDPGCAVFPTFLNLSECKH